MQIWIEVELHSRQWYDSDYICRQEWFNYSTFTTIDKKTWIWVKLSKEYYNTTIEYNFTPIENKKENYEVIKNFLNNQIEKYNLVINNSWPAFVWTHVHIFDEDKLNMRLSLLLKWVLFFLKENLTLVNEKGQKRLLLAHQLWWNFSHKNNHCWKQFLNERWINPSIYSDTSWKPKYNPVIFSLANSSTWKPKSIEIRVLPNEFIFNWKILELMTLIDNKKYLNNKLEVIDFYNYIYKSIYWDRGMPQSTNSSRQFNFDEAQQVYHNILTELREMRLDIHNKSHGSINNTISYYKNNKFSYDSLVDIIHHHNLKKENYEEFLSIVRSYEWQLRDWYEIYLNDIKTFFSQRENQTSEVF